jgi:hypothetical protein
VNFYYRSRDAARRKAEELQAQGDGTVQLKSIKVTLEENEPKDDEEGKPLKEDDEKKQDDKKEDGACMKENGGKKLIGKCDSRTLDKKIAGKTYEPKLWLALARAYSGTFLVASSFKLGHDILLFVSPLLLK